MTRHLIFDFDGTIVDTGRGIMNCVVKTFEHYGLTVPNKGELRTFVGPPLRLKFPEYGIPEEHVHEAIAYFRGHYAETGKDECEPYVGIGDCLEALVRGGYVLHVGTSKPEHFAHLLLERFDLKKYFTEITGALTDGSRDSKSDVLKILLSKVGDGDALMIGDTHYDVEGARTLGLSTVGVSWGYEDEASLKEAGAVHVVHSPRELADYLLNK